MTMRELIEVVFEQLSYQQLFSAFYELTDSCRHINNFRISNNDKYLSIHEINQISLMEAFQVDENVCMFVELDKLELPSGLMLPDVSMRLLKYDLKYYDLDFNFYLNYEITDSMILIDQLYLLSKKISNHYNIYNYYAGYEPAIDEDTRFFTKDIRGPLEVSKGINLADLSSYK